MSVLEGRCGSGVRVIDVLSVEGVVVVQYRIQGFIVYGRSEKVNYLQTETDIYRYVIDLDTHLCRRRPQQRLREILRYRHHEQKPFPRRSTVC